MQYRPVRSVMIIASLCVSPTFVTYKEERLFLKVVQHTLTNIHRTVLPTVEKKDVHYANIKQHSVLLFRSQDIYRTLIQIYSILSWHHQHQSVPLSHKLTLYRITAVGEGHDTTKLGSLYSTLQRAMQMTYFHAYPTALFSVQQELAVLYFICFTS